VKSFIHLAALGTLLLFNSCRKETPSAREAFQRAQSTYCSQDIRVAEAALSDYLFTISGDERRGLSGVDFELARVITYERLFLIYNKLGDTNRMSVCFAEATKHLTRHNIGLGVRPPTNSYASLIEHIEKYDAGLDVQWKRH
jgi:hypothetical protein